MKGWTERDFSEDVTGGVSFMDNVAAQVNDYKADLDQTTLVKDSGWCLCNDRKKKTKSLLINIHLISQK